MARLQSVYDVQKLLQKYGVIIYTGDRAGDFALMEMEIIELRKRNLISTDDFIGARHIIRTEKTVLGIK